MPDQPTVPPARSCRSQRVTLRYNDRPVPAYRGDTVASALYRAGVRIFSRSFKYHRPRGLLCVTGRCPNCLMQVDGTANVRACTTPVWDGQHVEPQNAYPSPEFDLLAAADSFGWLMPVGFYYKTFTHPAVWHRVEPAIRRVAGLGKVTGGSRGRDSSHPCYEHLHLHAEVAVVGGGKSGTKAALQAAEAGRSVILVDDQPELGGRLLDEPALGETATDGGSGGESQIEGHVSSLRDHPEVRVFNNAYCFGFYEDHLLGIEQRDVRLTSDGKLQSATERLIHLRADQVILATGTYESPRVFPNNDRVGVMLSSGVSRLINRYQVRPGRRAVIVSNDLDGGGIGEPLRSAGVDVVEVVSPSQIKGITGRRRVTGVRTPSGRLACDLVVVGGRQIPDLGLLGQAGGTVAWDEGKGTLIPKDLPPGVTVVGSAAGDSLRGGDIDVPSGANGEKRSFVCYCEDVTVKDLERAVAEGFDHIQTLKRYSTVTMGPCQGRMCQLASIGLCADRTGKSIAETGTTTPRPPLRSVSLGALAGARHHPIRRTPLHAKHDWLDCVWMNMGQWKRPLHYRSSGEASFESCVRREYDTVRHGVGMIDVSTLGKIEVIGADSVKLLEKVYTGRAGDLRVGRTRYSVICDETGTILDDGTITRLSDERFFLTTTTGNVEFVESWLQWWQVGTGWCAHVTNVTGGFAAVNVAGPQARAVLAKVADCDLGPKAFRYMACREATVGGIPCRMLRTGFVGEVSWELHCPSSYGESLWDLLMDAGRELGIAPVGVEAQRRLRLDKKHVIVGVDTDAMSNPLEADLAWVAKLEKDDFVGKAALGRLQGRAAGEKLVGFVVQDDTIPEDGAAVVLNGSPAGRVTSVRFSPSQDKAVGLAWIAAEAANEGREFQIHCSGNVSRAKIVSQPFYDPEGVRLRS